MIITISGYYGSGGNELGAALGEKLGYKVYNSELVQKVVETSNIDMKNSVLDFYDEDDAAIDLKMGKKGYSSALLALQMDVVPVGYEDRGISIEKDAKNDLLAMYMDTVPVNRRNTAGFLKAADMAKYKAAQKSVLEEATKDGNCILFGRCASYVLKDKKDIVRIFTTASMESCKKRISEVYGIDEKENVEELIRKTNSRRAYYYETFTDQKWEAAENYDYCIDVDYLGFDGTLELLEKIIELKSR